MRKLLALALVLVGCSAADPVSFAPPAELGTDAGGDAVVPPTPTTTGTGEPPPPPKVDSGAGGGGNADTATPDAGVTIEAAVDGAVAIEASTDAGADTIDSGSDAGGDAATIDADAAATIDAQDVAPDTFDAGGDATSDAVDSGLAPICAAASTKCDAPNNADRMIQSTFPQPCSPDGARKCGGIGSGGVVETDPMVCLMGRWRLAGYWSGVQWVPSYECTKGCGAVGKMCDP